jgi:hypothetical protein
MKKLLLLVGVAVGFVLGSKMGRQPYERLEAQIRQLAGRPEVKGAVDTLSDKAADITDITARAVNEKISDVTAAAKDASGSAARQGEQVADAVLDKELEGTFPTSDPPSSWAGPDIEPERPEGTP